MQGYLDVDGGIQVKSTLVFAAGTNQSTAVILNPYESSVLVSLTSNGQGIKLPTGSPGKRISFIRENNTFFYHLYPGREARINGKYPNEPLWCPWEGRLPFVWLLRKLNGVASFKVVQVARYLQP